MRGGIRRCDGSRSVWWRSPRLPSSFQPWRAARRTPIRRGWYGSSSPTLQVAAPTRWRACSPTNSAANGVNRRSWRISAARRAISVLPRSRAQALMATRCSWPRLARSRPTPFSTREMGYDPAPWVPIALLATGPYVLVLRKNFEASTVADLITRAKANPGKITSATPGAGSVGHLATVQLEMLAGITTAQIPYRGLSHALNDLIAG